MENLVFLFSVYSKTASITSATQVFIGRRENVAETGVGLAPERFVM